MACPSERNVTMKDDLYLSRLVLDTKSPRVQMGNAQASEMHRILMRGFVLKSTGHERADVGLLYRLESDHTGREQTLIVQSAVDPDWRFARTRGDRIADEIESKEVGDMFDVMDKGRLVRFRVMLSARTRVPSHLRVRNRGFMTGQNRQPSGDRPDVAEGDRPSNDSRKKHGDGQPRKRGREWTCTDIDDVINWFRNREDHLGFALTRAGNGSILLDVSRRVTIQIEGYGKSKVSGCMVNGVLTITDEAKFEQSVRNGIGRARTYGFGLLSLMPY